MGKTNIQLHLAKNQKFGNRLFGKCLKLCRKSINSMTRKYTSIAKNIGTLYDNGTTDFGRISEDKLEGKVKAVQIKLQVVFPDTSEKEEFGYITQCLTLTT